METGLTPLPLPAALHHPPRSPIDIVKQRVQTATVLAPGSGPRPTPLSVAREVWRGQGVRGFFRGYMAMNALW